MNNNIFKRAKKCYLQNGFIGVLKAIAFNMIYKLFYHLLSAKIYMSLLMYFRLGYWPNITKPLTLNEKIVHAKLFNPNPIWPYITDKWRVRKYVSQLVSSDILNDVLWVGKEPEKIPFNNLPKKYVIKPNHMSHAYIIVQEGKKIDVNNVITKCKSWLRCKYGKSTRMYELYYDQIEPLIIVEKYIDDGNMLPIDYKLYCFHGSVKYIHVICDRLNNFGELIYDVNWNLTNCYVIRPSNKRLNKPSKLDEMIRIAEILSAAHDYIRVDLYLTKNNEIIFGELTVTQGGGLGIFHPKEWDLKLGKLW